MKDGTTKARLLLEDGSRFTGTVFGAARSVSGEVVFNTGMVGYPESMTDPSYRGQILVLTYPLIGNYGVPAARVRDGLSTRFESDRIQIEALVVSEYSTDHSHWDSVRSLSDWLVEGGVPAIHGIDTRMLTKRLRDRGTMLGKIVFPENELYEDKPHEDELSFRDPNKENLVSAVSTAEPVVYPAGETRVALIDCGVKHTIIRSLLDRGVTVVRVPWNHDFTGEAYSGVVISNGPGNPKLYQEVIGNVRKVLREGAPVLGICLGNQLLAQAAGADTYKLKFGHRSQNQPCVEAGTRKCYITSQNHGFAVDTRTLPEDWEPWFVNANDGTNEGIRHRSKPFMSVQFHPEAAPGPLDTGFLFDEFLRMVG